MQKHPARAFLSGIFLIFCLFSQVTRAQMITGTWKGRINRQKAEVKIIQSGDSLTGTVYYYESANNYRRYSIRGYFDPETNSAVWWDDQLLEERSGRLSISTPGKVPLLSRADFNCPGSGRMMLDGKVVKKENDQPSGEVHLDKTGSPEFDDEWSFVIENYTVGGNDPYLIDSISHIHDRKPVPVEIAIAPPEKKIDPPVASNNTSPPKNHPPIVPTEKTVVKKTEPPPPVLNPVVVTPPESIEQKFVSRTKILTREIEVTGDSIELRFYDNGEVDGDSISLFLNNKLLFSHICLTAVPYTIRLAVDALEETNELIMVAENLGSIPPNTSYMLAIVGDKRYDNYLYSTEGTSAMIRFVKKQ